MLYDSTFLGLWVDTQIRALTVWGRFIFFYSSWQNIVFHFLVYGLLVRLGIPLRLHFQVHGVVSPGF